MATKQVIADASPLIGLAGIEAFDLLRGLFGRVTVAEAVYNEVLAGAALPGAAELEAAVEHDWVDVVPVGIDAEFADLGEGEACTLTLAAKRGAACLVLMDESLGRSHAKEHGIPVAGLVGVLLDAKRAGLIPEIRPFTDRLAETHFRISEDIVREVLAQAGED